MNKLLDNIRSLAVVAPHPDDESLGCAGLIALAREEAIPVVLIIASDGTGSHPKSRTYPPDRLRRLRAREVRNAAEILGVPEYSIYFLGLRDTAIPHHSRDREFIDARGRIAAILRRAVADTLAVTHRGEPHRDHRACYHIARSAAATLDCRIRLLEYRIWSHAPAAMLCDRIIHSLEISAVLESKREAIACHRSQTTDLIDDDLAGFRLSSADIARLSGPRELFEERRR